MSKQTDEDIQYYLNQEKLLKITKLTDEEWDEIGTAYFWRVTTEHCATDGLPRKIPFSKYLHDLLQL